MPLNNKPVLLGIDSDGPFFEMIVSFLAATIGLGPLYDPKNPMNILPGQWAWYNSLLGPPLQKNMQEVYGLCVSGALPANTAVIQLCCMLLNTAYERVKYQNDKSPEFEAFRHIRNAVSHGNKFHFTRNEPKQPAAWGSFTIDHDKKVSGNPLFGQSCVGKSILPGDALALLQDIKVRL